MSRVLRVVAILIAVAGAIDPAITSTRRVRPDVAVIAGPGSADAALADRVARQLAASFAVVRGPFAGAAAMVSVDDRLPGHRAFGASASAEASADKPAAASTFEPLAFAVLPEPSGPTVTVEDVLSPGRVHVQAQSALTVAVRARGAKGRRLSVTVRQATSPNAAAAGDVALERATFDIGTDDDARRVELTIALPAPGVTPLTIVAEIEDTPARAFADLAIDVRNDRRAVLFLDGRPSWMSTFVRRAVEADPRFVVTSRVTTSRDASVDRGTPPAALREPGSLALFDAVVVGAPDVLTAQDVEGLEVFLRERGGAVVFLLDQEPDDRPFARLLDVARWDYAEQDARRTIGATNISASEIASPAALPTGAVVLADLSSRPVIWRTPIGPGRVIVNGALDAWRYRDDDALAFDRFWRSLIADAAAATPPLIDVSLVPSVVTPGERTTVSVTVRDVMRVSPRSDRAEPLTATLGTNRAPTSFAKAPDVKLWPGERPGHFTATLRAPDTAGTYEVRVTGQGYDGAGSVIVAEHVQRPAALDRDLLAAWTTSRGGQFIPESRLSDLVPALQRALAPPERQETWHPMRSGWWIVPFALALGLEWWSRRRAGSR